MASARNGDTVKVHYTGHLDDGSLFDSSKDRGGPVSFTLGDGKVIPGVEAAVMGMAVGDEKTEEIRAADAFGPYRDELLVELERESVPDGIELSVGLTVEMDQEDGETLLFTVVELTDSTVTLDANHQLAGEDLTFRIQLVEITG